MAGKNFGSMFFFLSLLHHKLVVKVVGLNGSEMVEEIEVWPDAEL